MATATQETIPLSRLSAPDLFRLTRQGALTVKATIKPGREANLRDVLSGIDKSVGKEDWPKRFGPLQTVHFIRWVVLDANPAKGSPASLVLSTNYDEPLAHHLKELVDAAGDTLDQIYSHCEGYTGRGELSQYLRRHSIPYAAFYVGAPGRSVRLIKEEAKLRSAIQDYLDDPAVTVDSPTIIRDNIIKFVQSRNDLNWACSPPSHFAWYLFNYGQPVLILLALLAACVLVPYLFHIAWWIFPLVAILAVAAPVTGLAALVYVQEKGDAVDQVISSVGKVNSLAEREDEVVQNQLTHLADIKPQWFRPIALWVVLRIINIAARYVFIRGTLGGIPTIHFARWIIIDHRRLLFFSNYDGSWVNYLGDFIDKAAAGLTAIWSNTEGCPKAEGLVGAGAKDEQRFKSWTRNHQIFTDVWYSAYPELTVDNINNNSFIRIGLAGRLSPRESAEWLSRL